MDRAHCRRATRGWVTTAIFAAAAALAGCAGQQPPARNINQSGYSAAFRQGYADGCDSARAARRRDEQRYETDADYMMGWNDGRGACLKRK
jgi:hypothetical protein